MQFVSLPIEILRTKPRLVFWLAALLQASIWIFVPTLFYAAPPGNLAEFLSIANYFGRLIAFVPPLPYWLAEIAFRLGGFFGVYTLSQICVVVTLWAIFTLGRATLGARHAVLATLLMTGIYFMTMPTPDFSPAIMAMPIWSLALLHFWRATAQGRELYWIALAIDFGLLLATTYLATFFIALMVLFALLNPQSRARLGNLWAIGAAIAVVLMMIPHVMWLQASGVALPDVPNLRNAELIEKNVFSLLRILGLLLIGHAGLALMIAVAGSSLRRQRTEAVIIQRLPATHFASSFIYYFALVPALLLVIATVISGYSGAPNFGPVVVMSGLAAVLAAGDAIALYRQRTAIFTWFIFLLAPPVIAVMTALLIPWTAVADPRVAMPARDMGRFFSENFERRTGQKLEIIAGDPSLTSLISIGAASRPFVFGDEKAGLPRLLSRDEVVDKGAIVVWRATDSAGTPPADLRTQFPDLVPEVPRVFERRVEGRLPQLRLGWAMIRPKAQLLQQPQATPPRAQ